MPIRPASAMVSTPSTGQELNRLIRFGRARGRCETCQRPHGSKGAVPTRWSLVRPGPKTTGATAMGLQCPAPDGEYLDQLRLRGGHSGGQRHLLDHDPSPHHPTQSEKPMPAVPHPA